MFSGLRQNSLFYILEKGEAVTLKIGQVVSVSNPQPKYNQYQPLQPYNQPETTVDVKVKVGDDTMDFKQLPSHLSIVNFGQNGMVVSESKEAMSAEVEAMLRNSNSILDSIPYHKKVITSCDEMLRQLNPQFAKEKEQEEKIGVLEQKMGGIENTLSQMMGMLSKAVGHKNRDE
jgi:ribosomal protein L21E